MIIKSLTSDAELMRFIKNAEKYGHKLDCAIVAYKQHLDPQVEQKINERLPLFTIDIKNPGYCAEQFRRRGISDAAARTLLECPVGKGSVLVPYGFNRTVVMIEAILRGVDILFFVDYDVFPSVLMMTPDGPVAIDIDFFGAHLEQLASGSQVTTGEYSGYNILPPASFDGMDDLLVGLQKSEMTGYWQSSQTHRCLMVAPSAREIKPSSKILGGNVAIKLSSFSGLPPFFSSHYTVGGNVFLCRGEDTVLGLEIAKAGIVCTDIGLSPLHDTYQNYPVEPDLCGDRSVQERLYYACTGWVGRNPFLNYIIGADLKAVRGYQRERLKHGLGALVGYTSNPAFTDILKNFDTSSDNLGRYINEFENVLEAWEEFRNLCL